MRVAQDRHHDLVAFFDRSIEPLENSVEFSKAEVYMGEGRRKTVTLGLSKLLQHATRFGFPST